MNILWIADHWNTLDHSNDSTIYLAKLAEDKFGAKNYWCTPSDFSIKRNIFFVKTVGLIQNKKLLPQPKEFLLKHFHSLHWRADPPVTQSTLLTWNMLSSIKMPIFNAPNGLLKWNEKLSAFFYPNWIPKTYLFQTPEILKTFLKDNPEAWVVKNLVDAASRGVRLLSIDSKNLDQELLSLFSSKSPLLVQKYLKAIEKKGETRVFVLNGKYVGCLQKIPHLPGIMNLDSKDAKPKLRVALPSKTQLSRALKIAQNLKKDRIFLATVDFVGNTLLEINVTSPGLLQWYDSHSDESKKIGIKYWKEVLKSRV